jgi:FRG domain
MPHSFQGRDETSDVTETQSWWRLFTMQHYSTPTRLLDWSENALVALCFAVFSAPSTPTEDAVVWVLDPCQWNNLGNANHQRPLSVDEHGAGPYAPLPSSNQHVHAAWPLAVFGMHNSPRIITQQGTFVIFAPAQPSPMEEHAMSKGDMGAQALRAIKLDREHLGSMAKDLRRLGFAHSSLYPDLHGLSLDLKKEFGY